MWSINDTAYDVGMRKYGENIPLQIINLSSGYIGKCQVQSGSEETEGMTHGHTTTNPHILY